MGVQEMNASEMKEENGGFNIVDALIMCALANIVAGFQMEQMLTKLHNNNNEYDSL
jgi:regulator of RNase E activity RraB